MRKQVFVGGSDSGKDEDTDDPAGCFRVIRNVAAMTYPVLLDLST
jgi:hypothetical protein